MPRALIPERRALLMLAALACGSLLALPEPALCQGIRPGDQRIELPPPEPDTSPADSLQLPPLQELEPDARRRISAGLELRVERFEIVGSSVFSAEQLAERVSPWTARPIDSEELLAARDAVTRLYVENGYITSGALLPDQDPIDGVIRLEIQENGLGSVVVSGNRGFRDGYLRSRLMHAGRAPLRMQRLEERIRLLQQDARIARIAATLEPGTERGASRLVVEVVETRPFEIDVEALNDRSPAIGSWGGLFDVSQTNLVGYRDQIGLRTQITTGLRDIEARFAVPISVWDTELRFSYRDTATIIIEEPFEDLDVEASSRTWSGSLLQPLLRTPADEIWAGLQFDRRTTESSILGFEICFEVPTPDCDEIVLSVLRVSLGWTHRSSSDVFAARGLASFGLDTLGATRAPAPWPDGEFIAFLLQLQWIHVLPEYLLATQLAVRADAQVADDPLFSIEKFAIGGVRTVRGYRENQLVRDNGVVVSGELRIPVWRDASGRQRLQLVPFIDFGHVWNDEPPTVTTINTLSSAGVGLRFEPIPGLRAEVFWGGRLKSIPNPDTDLQDHGIHVRLAVYAP